MKTKSIQDNEIIKLLKSNYNIEIESIQLLQLGADMNASVYKATAKYQSYFVKIKYDIQEETDIDILRLLHDSGLKEIIFPVITSEGKLFRQLEHFKIVVYPFIDGKNGFEQALTKKQWFELGKVFKTIHTLTIPESIKIKLRKETFSTRWRESVKSLYPYINVKSFDNRITGDFKEFFKLKLSLINQLINLAETTSKNIQPDLNQYALCHSDIHAGNILIASDESFYIVDWDSPILAPKERDLMFIGGGVGNVWNSPTDAAYFYEGYGEVNIDKTLLSYYRCERIIEDIAIYGEDLLFPNYHTDESKLINLHHFKAMFEKNGVVDIALNHGR